MARERDDDGRHAGHGDEGREGDAELQAQHLERAQGREDEDAKVQEPVVDQRLAVAAGLDVPRLGRLLAHAQGLGLQGGAQVGEPDGVGQRRGDERQVRADGQPEPTAFQVAGPSLSETVRAAARVVAARHVRSTT